MTPGEVKKKLDEYLSDSYLTGAFCTLLICFSWVIYVVLAWERFKNETPYIILAVIVFGLQVLMLFLSSMLRASAGGLMGFDLKVTEYIRTKGLVVFTSIMIASIGLMCFLSGGSNQSPFSHYIIAIGSVYVVYARKLWNKIILTIVSVLVYSLIRFPIPYILKEVSNPAHLIFMDIFCIMVSMSVATIATLKLKDSYSLDNWTNFMLTEHSFKKLEKLFEKKIISSVILEKLKDLLNHGFTKKSCFESEVKKRVPEIDKKALKLIVKYSDIVNSLAATKII